MAIKRIFLHLLLLLVFVISCQDKKKENTEESTTDTELVASVEYQCPMDCEDGKTYHKEGSCPVCKMALLLFLFLLPLPSPSLGWRTSLYLTVLSLWRVYALHP